MTDPAPPANRVVVTDDGEAISLSVYGVRSASVLAALNLEPLVALRVAHELLGAAARHLNRGRA